MTSLETLDRACRKIILRDYRVSMCLGILEKEKTTPQSVLINVTLWVCRDAAADAFYDYRELKTVIDEATATPVGLQETLIDTIAARLLADQRVKAVRVASCKTQAFPNAAGIGVEIFREQS